MLKTADLEKPSLHLLRIISEADRPVREVTHLAVWSGMPRMRTLRAKRCPAGATGRRGHQLALDLLQARFLDREFHSVDVVALFTVYTHRRLAVPA